MLTTEYKNHIREKLRCIFNERLRKEFIALVENLRRCGNPEPAIRNVLIAYLKDESRDQKILNDIFFSGVKLEITYDDLSDSDKSWFLDLIAELRTDMVESVI